MAKLKLQSLAYLFSPTMLLIIETQMMFNEAIKKNYTLSLESGTTERRPVNTGKKFQLDVGASSYRSSPL